MNEEKLLGHDVQIFWTIVPKGKSPAMVGIFHGSNNGQYHIEYDGKLILIPFTSVRYLMEYNKPTKD